MINPRFANRVLCASMKSERDLAVESTLTIIPFLSFVYIFTVIINRSCSVHDELTVNREASQPRAM